MGFMSSPSKTNCLKKTVSRYSVSFVFVVQKISGFSLGHSLTRSIGTYKLGFESAR